MSRAEGDGEGLLFVVGMRREAQILGSGRRVAVGRSGLDAALADRRPGALISFGLCGALAASLRCGDLIVATQVDGPDGPIAADAGLGARIAGALPGSIRGRVLGSDAIVGDAAGKAALAASTGAIAVDMESHVVALAAQRAGAPFAVVRAVSDAAADTLPRAAQAGFRADGEVDVLAVLAALARRPWEIVALVATARNAGAGFRALERAAPTLPR